MGDAGSRGQLRRDIILYFYLSLSLLPIIYIMFDIFSMQWELFTLVPSPSETWFRGMSVGGSFRRV